MSLATKKNVLTSPRQVPDISARSLQKMGFPDRFSLKVPQIKFQVNPSSGSCADTCGQSDRHMDRRTDGLTT